MRHSNLVVRIGSDHPTIQKIQTWIILGEFYFIGNFWKTSLFPSLDLVYDYYGYPQLYDGSGDTDTSNYDQDEQEIYADPSETSSDYTDKFVIQRDSAEISNKHVTYVPNGAVISNVPTESSIYETAEDALIIDNPDYDDTEWLQQDNNMPNSVRLVTQLFCT